MSQGSRTPTNTASDARHTPVMLPEVLEALAPRDGGIYVDGTFGAGGYSRALLEAANCNVRAIDRDPEAIAAGHVLAAQYGRRLTLHRGRYGEMDQLLSRDLKQGVDGIALDLGVSSMQLDEPERGFSFRFDGPLDMRMEGVGESPSAAEVVNQLDESVLADIIYLYGEERRARRVARAIVAARSKQPILRTAELADIVRAAVGPAKTRRSGGPTIDPATRSFQALRIYVNDELGELDRGLQAAERLLAPGGRLAVVAFHSLEDRAVKAFLTARSGGRTRASRHLPETPGQVGPAATFSFLFRGARKASATECAVNPRARSARLRAAVRTAAAPWPENTNTDRRP